MEIDSAWSGPSGAGKTVLLRALALLDPLDSGTILWQGRAECGEGVPRYRKRVIYLHQRPALFEGTVEDNLRLPFGLRVIEIGIRPEAALELLAVLGRDDEFLSKPSRRPLRRRGPARRARPCRSARPDRPAPGRADGFARLATAQAVEGLLDSWLAARRGDGPWSGSVTTGSRLIA